MKLIVHTHENYARFLIPEGGATFSLSRVEKMPEGKGIHVYFEVDDCEQAVSDLKKQGMEFISLPELKSWLWTEAHLLDPDGNHLIIYHAGVNRVDPPWKLLTDSELNP